MSAGLTMPKQSITLMLADPWTTPDYTDITPLVESWNGKLRGRQHELQRFQAGTVKLSLNNQDGRFSPWNTGGPYYNMLSPGDASSETVDGTANTIPAVDNWLSGSTAVHCTVEQAIPSVIIDGPVAHGLIVGYDQSTTVAAGSNGATLTSLVGGALDVVAVAGFNAAGNVTVLCNTGGSPAYEYAVLSYTSTTSGSPNKLHGIAIVEGIGSWTVVTGSAVQQLSSAAAATLTMADNIYPVTAGQYYSVMASFLADSSVVPNAQACTCQINVAWYTSGGVLISTSTGPQVTDNQATWTKSSLLGVQAPATAAYAALQVELTGAGAEETHYFSRCALFNYTAQVPNTAWAPGQRGLVPLRAVKHVATWGGIAYPQFLMYVDSWIPTYGQVRAHQTIQASDAMSILAIAYLDVSVYAGQVVADGATQFFRFGDPIGTYPSVLETVSGYRVGTISGTAPLVFGQAGPLLTDATTAVLFDAKTIGIAGYLAVPGYLSGTAYSLECWFMSTAPPAGGGLYGLYTQQNSPPTTTQVSLYIDANGRALYTEDDTSGSVIGQVFASSGSLCDGNWHHIVATRSGTTMNLYVDGALYANSPQTMSSNRSTVINNQAGIGANSVSPVADEGLDGFLADVAFYDGITLTPTVIANHYALGSAGFVVQFSGQRIAAILNAYGWPASLQNIATGISAVQAASSSLANSSALSYVQTVESTEMGAFYVDESGVAVFRDRHYILTNPDSQTSVATFASDTAAGHYHYLPKSLQPGNDDLDLWNDIPAQRQKGVLQRAQSLLSIKQYLRRTLSGYTSGLQTSDAEVVDLSQWLLAHYGTPLSRVRSIALDNAADAGANLPQMLGRTLLDRITVQWLPIDGSTVKFAQDSLIESITHDVTQSTWTTTWELSPAETQSYLILNDTVYGRLSEGNRLAY